MVIETQRLLLREMQAADIRTLAGLWTDPEVTQYMGGPRDVDEVSASLAEDLNVDPPPQLDLWPVIEKVSGDIVGHCGLLDKVVDGRMEVDLTYAFARSVWGRGYATEMALALKGYAFEQLGLERFIAIIAPENVGSQHVAEKVGLRYEKDSLRPSGQTKRIYAVQLSEGS